MTYARLQDLTPNVLKGLSVLFKLHLVDLVPL